MFENLSNEQLIAKCYELQALVDKYAPKAEYGHDGLEKKSYYMELDFGRSGELTSQFNAEPELVDILLEGNITVYFGEVLGKHSEVYNTLSDDDIDEIEFTNNEFGDFNPFEQSFIERDLISEKYNVDAYEYENVYDLCVAIYESRK